MNRAVGVEGGNESSYDHAFESEVKSVRFRSESHLAAAPTSGNRSRRADDDLQDKLTPSPTGYRDYTPPAELIQNRYHTSGSSPAARKQHDGNQKTCDSYSMADGKDVKKKDEAFTHKTILLGDSGVGKTSLLVQFDTGQFQTGNFAATVGIGFTGFACLRGNKAAASDGDEEWPRRRRANWCSLYQDIMSVTEEEEEPACRNTNGRGSAGYTRRRISEDGIANDDWTFAASVAAAKATLRANTRQTTQLLNYQRNSYEGPSAISSERHTNNYSEYYFKVMLLGDSGVGKTCLLTRFRDDRFLCGNYISTVGIDFRNKIITVDDTRVKLQIWDTAGQERFRSVTHAYYRDAHALLLLYDVTNKTSYDNIRAWLGEIREYAHEDVVIMLLGNKSDCGNERIVKREDGERLAREHNVPFMETSAKTGLNVELAFFAVARHLKARKSGDPDTSKFNVQDYVRQQSQKNNCFNYNCSTT